MYGVISLHLFFGKTLPRWAPPPWTCIQMNCRISSCNSGGNICLCQVLSLFKPGSDAILYLTTTIANIKVVLIQIDYFIHFFFPSYWTQWVLLTLLFPSSLATFHSFLSVLSKEYSSVSVAYEDGNSKISTFLLLGLIFFSWMLWIKCIVSVIENFSVKEPSKFNHITETSDPWVILFASEDLKLALYMAALFFLIWNKLGFFLECNNLILYLCELKFFFRCFLCSLLCLIAN